LVEVFHLVALMNETQQRIMEMIFFKQGRSSLFQPGQVPSMRTCAPLAPIRPARRMSAVPPRQVPTEEPPTAPVEMPPDAPELPEPSSPEIPGVPPHEAPVTTPSEMPQEEGWGQFDGETRSSASRVRKRLRSASSGRRSRLRSVE